MGVGFGAYSSDLGSMVLQFGVEASMLIGLGVFVMRALNRDWCIVRSSSKLHDTAGLFRALFRKALLVPRPSFYPLYTLNRDHIPIFKGYKEGPGCGFRKARRRSPQPSIVVEVLIAHA